MASRRHLAALNKALKARGLEGDDVAAPWVALARDLARELDKRAGAISGDRVVADYRAVLHALDRLTFVEVPKVPSNTTKSGRGSTETEGEKPAEVSSLDAFREKWGIT